MLTLVICLVVLGGSIAAVLVLSLGGEEQPATDGARAHRERPARPALSAPGLTARLGQLARRTTSRTSRTDPGDAGRAPAGPRPAMAATSAQAARAVATPERPAPAPAPGPAAPARPHPPARPARTVSPRQRSWPGAEPSGVRVITVSPWRRVRAMLGLVAMTAVVGLLVAGLVALAALAIALGLREAVG